MEDQPWQLAHVEGLQVIVVQRPDRHLEGKHFPAVVEKTSDDEVHALGVTGAARVLAQGLQNNFESRPSVAVSIEEAILWVRPRHIKVYLLLVLLLKRLLLDSLVEDLAVFEVDWHVGILLDQLEPLAGVDA